MPFTDSEQAVITHLYRDGDDVPGNIADATGYHRKSIQRTLSGLETDEIVENKGQGVYRLTLRGVSAARAFEQDDEN